MKIGDALKTPASRLGVTTSRVIADSQGAKAPTLASGQAKAAKELLSGRTPAALAKASALPLRAAIGHKLDGVKSQLAEVEVDIKTLMQQIAASRAKENAEQSAAKSAGKEANRLQLEVNRQEASAQAADDARKSSSDHNKAILDSLRKTMDTLDEIRRATSQLG